MVSVGVKLQIITPTISKFIVKQSDKAEHPNIQILNYSYVSSEL
jgi:hypothetical protein